MKHTLRPIVLTSLLCLVGLSMGISSQASAAPSAGFTDLGQILGSSRVDSFSIAGDGTIYAIAGTISASHLISINPADSAVTDRGVAPGGQNWSAATTVGQDGKVYGGAGCTTGAFLWMYDPANGTFTNKGQAVPGVQCFTMLVTGSNGKIYGATEDNTGTGSHGFVFEYDPNSSSFTGAWGFPNTYNGEALAVGSNNRIFVGTWHNGTPSASAHFYVLDTSTRTLTDKGVPIATEDGIVSLAMGNDGKVYGGTQPNGHFFSYDPNSGQFLDKGQAVAGQTRIVSLFSFQNKVYGGTSNWSGLSPHVFEYSTATLAFTDLGIPVQGEFKTYLVVTPNGKMFGGTSWHGHLFSYVVPPQPNIRYPIVFVHGWNGFSKGCDAQANDPRSGFSQVAADLQGAGYNVFFTDIQSTSCSTPPIEWNVQKLEQAIDTAKTSPNQKVILIAHSMGGLVARAYIEGDDYPKRNDVYALFTFGTPHQGIPEVALAYGFAGVTGVAGLAVYCVLQPAVCEFSEPGIFFFNLRYSNRRLGVTYHVINGDGTSSSLSPLGMAMSRLIGGADDATVAVSSGTGLPIYMDRRQTDEVHASQLGTRDYFSYIAANQPSRSYTECLKPVLANPSANCGTPSLRRPSPRVPSSTTNHTPFLYGTVQPGAAITNTILLEGGATLFASGWQTPTLAMTLVDPNGQVIDPGYASSHPSVVTYQSDSISAIYNFPNAMAGSWRVVLQDAGLPAGGTPFTTFAILSNNLTLSAQMDQIFYTPGSTASISATLGGSPATANVTATIARSDGITQTISLAPIGGGQWQGAWPVPAVPGYTEARVKVSGTIAGGAGFEREAVVLFQITSNRASLSGSYSDVPEPRSPGSNLYSALLVNAGINVSSAGKVGLSADLYDMAGNFVAHSATLGDGPAGPSTLTLRFDGVDIYASQRNGPYRLTNLLLTDEQNAMLVIAQATNAYTTAFYDYRSFALPTIYLPFITR